MPRRPEVQGDVAIRSNSTGLHKTHTLHPRSNLSNQRTETTHEAISKEIESSVLAVTRRNAETMSRFPGGAVRQTVPTELGTVVVRGQDPALGSLRSTTKPISSFVSCAFTFFSFLVSSSSSGFLLASSAEPARKRRVEEYTTSPDTPASTRRPRVGSVSLEGVPLAAVTPLRPGVKETARPAPLEVETSGPVGRRASRSPPPPSTPPPPSSGAVVECRRQFHGYHQPFMTVPCPEPAFSPPCSGSHAFAHGDRQSLLHGTTRKLS